MDTTDSAGAATEADARVLEAAAEVLRRRFGVLTAGDVIGGLTSCTRLLRSGTGIIRPAQAEEPGHGYHEAGDH